MRMMGTYTNARNFCAGDKLFHKIRKRRYGVPNNATIAPSHITALNSGANGKTKNENGSATKYVA